MPVAAAVKTMPLSDAETEPYLNMMDRIKEAQDIYNEAREKGQGKFQALHSARSEIKGAIKAKEEYEVVLQDRPAEPDDSDFASDPSLEELALEELAVDELDDEAVDGENLEDEETLEEDETLAERLWGDGPELVLPEE